MSSTLIVGYGNKLRGDDAVGYLAAERLRENNLHPEIEILPVHQLTPELVDPISRAARVFFIDAAAGPTPGQITERPVRADPAGKPFTHMATPEALLAGAAALYGAEPPATLLTVTAASFEVEEKLSPPVREALDSIVEYLQLFCADSANFRAKS